VSKNVAVFVDVANIFYAAKAAGVDIDYVTLLKTASAGRDLVRAYAYTGLDPDNENQRNFHDFLRRHGYKVVSKDIRKYGDGKVKANLDIELVVDMMKTARNLDIAIVISGDGDFAPAIRAVQEMGVRVEVISFRGNTSSDLIEVADQFTEITQIARVEKGSSRSGRRVADDEEDLSMTEVPDKQSEGTGSRGRGRGRSRVRPVEAEVVVAPARGRGRARPAEVEAAPIAAVAAGGPPLVVLPGEKLSRAAVAASRVVSHAADIEEPEEAEEAAGEEPRVEGEAEDGTHRRRRRRGGRGRGRGRGRDEVAVTAEGGVAAVAETGAEEDEDLEEELPPTPGPAKRSTHAFGSVWDSQIGVPVPSGTAAASTGLSRIDEEEDLDEPPIPEYLIAERNQRSGARAGVRSGGPGAGRGTRGGYAAAIDRERFGGARSASRFAEPAPRGGGRGGEGRAGEGRGGESRGGEGRGGDRFRSDRPAPRAEIRSGSADEPWSEVPPEIEAMLRAQLGTKVQRPAGPPARAAAPAEQEPAAAPVTRRRSVAKPAAVEESVVSAGFVAAEPAPAPRRRTIRKPAEPAQEIVAASAVETAEAAPKRRSTRKVAAPPATETPAAETAEAAPKRRSTRKQASSADA
jgi:uncharacterized LabA/DUF88 family protein